MKITKHVLGVSLAAAIAAGGYALVEPSRGAQPEVGTAAPAPLQADGVISPRTDAQIGQTVRSQRVSLTSSDWSQRRAHRSARLHAIEARTCLPLKVPCSEPAECCSGYCCNGLAHPHVCVTAENYYICNTD